MGEIQLEAKSDRELLILAVQKQNEMIDHLKALNNSVAKNSKDITCDQKNLASLPCRILGKYYWIAIILVVIGAVSTGGDFTLKLLELFR